MLYGVLKTRLRSSISVLEIPHRLTTVYLVEKPTVVLLYCTLISYLLHEHTH